MAIEISANNQWLSLPSRNSRGWTCTFWFRYDGDVLSNALNCVCCIHGAGLVGFIVDRAGARGHGEVGLWSAEADLGAHEVTRINPGIWYFGCIVVDGAGNCKIGIGSRDASGNGFIDFTVAGTVADYNAVVKFGSNDWGWWFDGAIADIRLVAATALSDADIIAELESDTPVSASVTSWFRLDDNTDTADQIGAVVLTQNDINANTTKTLPPVCTDATASIDYRAIGDSIVWGQTGGATPATTRFAALRTDDNSLTNTGISGARLSELYDLDSGVHGAEIAPAVTAVNATRPTVALVMAGTNDICLDAVSAANTYARAQTVVRVLKARGIAVIFTTAIDRNVGAGLLAELDAFDVLLRGTTLGSDYLADPEQDVEFEVGGVACLDLAIYSDGTHPTTAGNVILGDYWDAAMTDWLASLASGGDAASTVQDLIALDMIGAM